jgi:CheY-like chemotaxis protein
MNSDTRVMVVDDYVDGADALGILLSGAGYSVCVVNEGRQAIETAATFQPHIVILDLLIPDMNGFDVAVALKEQPWSDAAVFVAHTGMCTRDIVAKVKQAGFQHFLRKPSCFDDFESILSSLPSSLLRDSVRMTPA